MRGDSTTQAVSTENTSSARTFRPFDQAPFLGFGCGALVVSMAGPNTSDSILKPRSYPTTGVKSRIRFLGLMPILSAHRPRFRIETDRSTQVDMTVCQDLWFLAQSIQQDGDCQVANNPKGGFVLPTEWQLRATNANLCREMKDGVGLV